MAKEPVDQVAYTDDEAQRRFEAALRGARLVAPKPHSEMKVGKRHPSQNLGKVETKPTKAKKGKPAP